MPLQQRVIEPVNVSRSTLPLPPGDIKPLIKNIAAATGQGMAANAAAAANINIVNELECVTNGTLSNIIRQLSSLSKQSEQLLSGVFDEASKLLTRTVSLHQRMESLNAKVEALDHPSDASITLRDPTNQHESFSSDMTCDQQVLAKQQIPSSVQELYEMCDKPPPLNLLDPFRDDGKDGLKFYTDPTYFFELWKKDMIKETTKIQNQQAQPTQQQLRQEQLQKQNQATRTLQQQKRFSQNSPQQLAHHLSGKGRQQVVSINGSYTSSTTYVSSAESNLEMYGQNGNASMNQAVRGNIDLDKTTDSMTRYMQQATLNDAQMPINNQQHERQQINQQAQKYDTIQNKQNPGDMNQLPNANMQQYQSGPYVHSTNQPMMETPPPPPALSPLPAPMSPPPPPPPPAPPAPPALPIPASVTTPVQHPPVLQPPTAAQLQQKQQQLRKTVPMQRDPRSDLLAAIKQGITLRRVEDSKRRVEAEKQQSMGNDVASILARRVAMQVSDSDDDGEDGDEDNDWEDSINR